MNVLVVNAFIRAAVGDAALLSVMIDQIRQAFPGCRVQVSTLDDPRAHPTFDGAPNLGSMRRYGADESIPRWRRAVRKLLIAAMPTAARLPLGARAALARVLPPEVTAELEAIESADLVVSVGGGYLNGGPGLSGDLSVANMVAPLAVAQALGVPVFGGPQSIGPFATRRQRQLVAAVLQGCHRLVLREHTSAAIVREMGVDGDHVSVLTDAAFAFGPGADDDWRGRLGVHPDAPLVGLTARQWFDPTTQARFERELSVAVDDLQDQGFTVVLIPQVISELAGEDDRDVNARIARGCRRRDLVREVSAFDHEHAKSLYRELDYLIGMRFHSVIFGLTSGTASIAIEYHHKAGGIMADLGLSSWVIGTDGVLAGELPALFGRLRTERVSYQEHRAAGVRELSRRADEVVPLLRASVLDPVARIVEPWTFPVADPVGVQS